MLTEHFVTSSQLSSLHLRAEADIISMVCQPVAEGLHVFIKVFDARKRHSCPAGLNNEQAKGSQKLQEQHERLH